MLKILTVTTLQVLNQEVLLSYTVTVEIKVSQRLRSGTVYGIHFE